MGAGVGGWVRTFPPSEWLRGEGVLGRSVWRAPGGGQRHLEWGWGGGGGTTTTTQSPAPHSGRPSCHPRLAATHPPTQPPTQQPPTWQPPPTHYPPTTHLGQEESTALEEAAFGDEASVGAEDLRPPHRRLLAQLAGLGRLAGLAGAGQQLQQSGEPQGSSTGLVGGRMSGGVRGYVHCAGRWVAQAAQQAWRSRKSLLCGGALCDCSCSLAVANGPRCSESTLSTHHHTTPARPLGAHLRRVLPQQLHEHHRDGEGDQHPRPHIPVQHQSGVVHRACPNAQAERRSTVCTWR